jgi:hypothetical protein
MDHWWWLEQSDYHDYQPVSDMVFFGSVFFEWLRITGNKPTVWWGNHLLNQTDYLKSFVMGFETRELSWCEDGVKMLDTFNTGELKELMENEHGFTFNSQNKMSEQHFIIYDGQEVLPDWLIQQVNIGIIETI